MINGGYKVIMGNQLKWLYKIEITNRAVRRIILVFALLHVVLSFLGINDIYQELFGIASGSPPFHFWKWILLSLCGSSVISGFAFFATPHQRQSIASDLMRSLRDGSTEPRDGVVFLYLRSFINDGFIGERGTIEALPEFVSVVRPDMLRDPPVLRNSLGRLELCTKLEYGSPAVQQFLALAKSRRDWRMDDQLGLIDDVGLCIAIGDTSTPINAAIVRSTDESWQRDVDLLMHEAQVMVFAPGNTDGTHWELRKLVDNGFLGKTLFANPGNNIVLSKKPQLEEQARKDKEVDQNYYSDFPQVAFWNELSRRYSDYEFPDFEPLGEWFVLETSGSDSQSKLTVADRQTWGKSPVLDLLALAQRRGLITVDGMANWRLQRYLRKRSAKFGLSGDTT
jgi:hypothetical protein